jgi:5-methylcytosine-specific restriction endonuclease McrA
MGALGKQRTQFEVRRRRRKLFEASGGRCYWCGEPTHLNAPTEANRHIDTKYATIDHLLPQQRGGSFRRENTVLACYECNERRGGMGKGKFRRLLNKEAAASKAQSQNEVRS